MNKLPFSLRLAVPFKLRLGVSISLWIVVAFGLGLIDSRSLTRAADPPRDEQADETLDQEAAEEADSATLDETYADDDDIAAEDSDMVADSEETDSPDALADAEDNADAEDPGSADQFAGVDEAFLNQVMTQAMLESAGQVNDAKQEAKDTKRKEDAKATRQAQPKSQPRGSDKPAAENEEKAATPTPAATPSDSSVRITDSSELNLSGNDIVIENIGDNIIISGVESDLDILQALVKQLDAQLPDRKLEMVILEKKDAKELAKQLQTAIDSLTKTKAKPRPEDQVNIIPVSNNILLISAPAPRLDQVVAVAKELDAAPERLPAKDPMLFAVKHRKAAEAATKLKTVIDSMRKVQGATPGEKYDIIPNDADNTILIVGLDVTERSKIQQMLDAIDVQPVEGYGAIKLVHIPLLNVEAKTLAQVITDMLSTPEGRKNATETIRKLTMVYVNPNGSRVESLPVDLEKPFRIIADEGTNSLILATVDENIEPISEIIKLLDDVPDAVEFGLQMFPLEYADADSVAKLLNDFFKEGKKLDKLPKGGDLGAVGEGPVNKAMAYEVSITADPRTNIVFAAGRAEQMAVVKSMVDKLDVAANALKFPLRLLFLGENLDATRAGQIVTELFDQRLKALKDRKAGPAAIEKEQVFMAVDPFANALIVSASDDNYKEISNICKQLDVAPGALIDSIRLITCKNTSAADLKSKIEELWKRKAQQLLDSGGGKAVKDVPVIVADSRSNSLVIASSPEDFRAIQQLVDTLEKQELAPLAEIQLVPLQHNDAKSVGDLIQKIFDDRMKQRMVKGQEENPADKVAIGVDVATNTLLVAASPDNYAEIERLVGKIDAEHAEFKIYSLQHASAVKLAPKMQDMFDKRATGSGSGKTKTINIQADEGSNSLICSGSPDQQVLVAELLTLLDKQSNIAQQMQIFPLEKANATALADRLSSLFKSKASSSGGGGGGSDRADATAVEPEPRSNSLIVWAAPTDMENIAEIIGKLDQAQPTKEMMVKHIVLKQALAADFAKLFQSTVLGNASGSGSSGGGSSGKDSEAVILSFEKLNDDGTKEVRKLVRQDITITPDPYTNSLLVMAPAESMEMLETMIVEFDKVQPQQAEIRLFPLVNADADEMVKKLGDLFKSDAGKSGEMERQLLFGDASAGAPLGEGGVIQQLTFASDRRTNTVIAAGRSVDLTMVERLVSELDSKDVEDRINTVVKPGYRPAKDIAKAVEDFTKAEDDRLKAIQDESSVFQQAERAVTMVSVGDKDSDAVILGVSPRYYDQYMDMIYQLDRPQPQVMIQALLAEVTLNDTLDLGLEFAAQDLLFSEKAVAGPNGTLKGPNFDFVGGTDLGTANIGGGFSFATTGEDFNLLFRALQTNSKVEVLSRPTIMVRNNQEAEIILGDKVPTISGTQINPQGSTSSTVTYNEVGIKLNVTPNINPDGYVSMEVKPEISSQTDTNIQLTEGLSAPIFHERSASTLITIKDGETVVIGGLMTDSRTEMLTKVPILGDIPILGFLGSSTGKTINKTELLIVLTVDVLWSDEDIRKSSIKERDGGAIPMWMKNSPHMEGLRILPEDDSMGPVDSDEVDPSQEAAPVNVKVQPANSRRQRNGGQGGYGPKVPTEKASEGTVISMGYGPTPPDQIRLASAAGPR